MLCSQKGGNGPSVLEHLPWRGGMRSEQRGVLRTNCIDSLDRCVGPCTHSLHLHSFHPLLLMVVAVGSIFESNKRQIHPQSRPFPFSALTGFFFLSLALSRTNVAQFMVGMFVLHKQLAAVGMSSGHSGGTLLLDGQQSPVVSVFMVRRKQTTTHAFPNYDSDHTSRRTC